MLSFKKYKLLADEVSPKNPSYISSASEQWMLDLDRFIVELDRLITAVYFYDEIYG